MTNRWIDWGNKLSWRFVPGRATEEHTFTYSLQMAPNAVTQEFNLCQLPSFLSLEGMSHVSSSVYTLMELLKGSNDLYISGPQLDAGTEEVFNM